MDISAKSKKSILDMIEQDFMGDRKAVAESADMSIFTLNNLVDQKRDVLLLADGGWILESSRTKVFRLPTPTTNEDLKYSARRINPDSSIDYLGVKYNSPEAAKRAFARYGKIVGVNSLPCTYEVTSYDTSFNETVIFTCKRSEKNNGERFKWKRANGNG